MRGSGFSPTLRATSYRNGSRASNGPTFLTAAEMEKYHIHFAESEEFGDAYLITDPGTIFFSARFLSSAGELVHGPEHAGAGSAQK